MCFCPNGDPGLEAINGVKQYDGLWGKVHPMLITPRFLRETSVRYGFRAYVCTNPYRLDDIATGDEHNHEIMGSELCLIAKRI